MTDSRDSAINVSAFNLFADKMNEIFEVIIFFFFLEILIIHVSIVYFKICIFKINKKYYITDFTFKHKKVKELQFQADSVIIECIDEPDENNFSVLLKKDLNTFSGKYLYL